MMAKQFTIDTHRGAVFYRFIDYLVIAASLILTMFLYVVPFSNDYLLVLALYLVFFSFIGESLQIYRSWRIGKFNKLLAQVIAVQCTSVMLLFTLLFVVKISDVYSRVVIIGWFTVATFLLISWRVLAKKIRQQLRLNGYSMQDVAIIGLNKDGMNLFNQFKQHPELGFRCYGFFDDRNVERLNNTDQTLIKGNVKKAVLLAKEGKLSKIYLALPITAEERIAEIVTELGDTTADVILLSSSLLKNIMHARIGHIGNVDTISVFESPIYGIRDFYKRIFDICFSFTALIAISPLLCVIALAVKVTSKGPVLFKQRRYGLNGKHIDVFKFRSMTVTENAEKVKQATKNDVRITPIGKFLRRTSLDELPQFLNVLLGDMSVVGPRPHAVSHNETYRKIVNYYMLRHQVKPGITGWAQINGWRGETDTLVKMEKRVEFDLEYIRSWSLWFDIKIIFLTLFKGFVGKNAY
jgi:putative colanic acid biosynthesis UDP-glucose lipid carrier transferase